MKKFWKYGGPEKKIRHEKVTRSCIPPHGFFSSQFDVFCEELIHERPNSSLKNPWGGIHGLVTFSCPNFFFGAPCSKNLQRSICLIINYFHL